MDRDTKLRHDVVTALRGVVGARLAGIRLMEPCFGEETAISALMAQPFHSCSGVELLLEPEPSVLITLEPILERESWESAEEWLGDFALVAKRTKADTTDSSRRTEQGLEAVDATDLPVWRGHVGKNVDRIQLMGLTGNRESGPAVVRLEFLDGAVWVGCGAATSGSLRFGDGDEVLVASELQARELSDRQVLAVLWDSAS